MYDCFRAGVQLPLVPGYTRCPHQSMPGEDRPGYISTTGIKAQGFWVAASLSLSLARNHSEVW